MNKDNIHNIPDNDDSILHYESENQNYNCIDNNASPQSGVSLKDDLSADNNDIFKKENPPTPTKKLLGFLKDIAVVVFIVFLISFFLKAIVVQGISMEPTLQTNNYLLISKQSYTFGSPHRGDIVVFPHDDGVEKKLYIKRVIGIPNDKLIIRNHKLWINGKLQNEKYIKGNTTDGLLNLTIPKGEVFVMGDNRDNSSDSRIFGTVPIKTITGKAIIRLYPFDKIELF